MQDLLTRLAPVGPAGGSAAAARQSGPSPALAAAQSFAATVAEGEAASRDALLGQGDPHRLMTAVAESRLAVESVVALRDRAVEAYQEILRMPV